MKISRIIYGLLVITLIISYFQPWMIGSNQVFPGWSTILPFSFFYFVGLIISIIILFTGYRAVGLSILAGVLMVGSNLITGVFLGLGVATKSSEFGSGFYLAFITSLIFVTLGPICGSYFDKTSNVKVSGEGFWSKLFWGLGISILAAIILHYVFHI